MIFLVLLLGFSCPLFSKGLDVKVSASSAILMNAETGAILFEKEAHTQSHPASTTKIATALYVLDKGVDLNRTVTVSAECLKPRSLKDREQQPAYWLDGDGTTMGLKRGEMVSFETLLHGLMLVSGNDAANVIAESVGGSIPRFMNLLNEYLRDMGCKGTRFCNPHGLTYPEHYSTAYDLALMARKALKIPQFRKIVSTLSYAKPKSNKQPPVELKLTNGLMRPKSKNYYPKAIGIKTGYTAAAKYAIVAAAEQEGRTLIAVAFGCEKSNDRYEDVKKLFSTAFAENKAKRRLIGPENVFMKEIAGSKKPLKAALNKELQIEYFPSEEPKCKAVLHWAMDHLPIRKGQKVGEVHILEEDSGLFLQKGDLLSMEDVKLTFLQALKKKIGQLFK